MNKKKKKPPKTKIVVVTAYRGTKDQELDLNVGDEVTVLKKVRLFLFLDVYWTGKLYRLMIIDYALCNWWFGLMLSITRIALIYTEPKIAVMLLSSDDRPS